MVLYAARKDELPTRPTFELSRAQGKGLLWPRIAATGEIAVAVCDSWEQLVPDALGVLAPPASAASERLGEGDLVLVPGVAFTRAGARLGRGGGHYDRLLAAAAGAISAGLAFDLQLVPEIPIEAHDRPVDLVVTPDAVWRRTQWRT